MRALRFHGAGDLRLDDVPDPTCPPGWATIAVTACGICGTDLHEYQRGPQLIPPPGRLHVLTGESLPLTMGHELAGEIVEVGSGVGRVAVGDRVAVDPSIGCGACDACQAGLLNRCPRRGAVGLHGWGGGFAEFVSLPESMLHRLAPHVSSETGALVEPLAVGWHGAEQGGVGAGSHVLVIGCGPIGIGAIVAARALGAAQVVAVARRDGVRSRVAADLGADTVLRSSSDPVDDAVADATDGVGFDVVLECSGAQAGMDHAVAGVRIGGSVVTLGVWDTRPQMDLNLVLLREAGVVGSRGYGTAYPRVVAALEDGRIPDVSAMITGRVPLARAVELGFDALVVGSAEHLKVLVSP